MVLAHEVESLIPIQLTAPKEVIPQDMLLHAKRIWLSIEAFTDPNTALPADILSLENPDQTPNHKTSPTNIGLRLLDIIAAEKLGFLSQEESRARIDILAKTLAQFEYPNGLPASWYDTHTAKIIESWEGVDSEPSYPIKNSAVDTAWFLAGIYGALQAFPDIPELKTVFESINLGKFYDPDSHLCIGELSSNGEKSCWKYGALSEARVISYIGVALGHIPPDHLTHLWENAKKLQEERFPEWPTLHPGTVPTWRGNVFERAMLLLIFDEARLSPIWLATHQDCVDTQRRHADPTTDLWGYSPASSPTPMGEYIEYGIPNFGLYPQGSSLGISNGEIIERVITPHALYMALTIDSHSALQAINRLAQVFPDSWGSYGYPDSFNTATGDTSRHLLILDQSMAFLALAQHLKPECVRKHFKPLEDKLVPHLEKWKVN